MKKFKVYPNRTIKASSDYWNRKGDNFTGIHPIEILVCPDLGTWFEEDHFANLGAFLGIDADDLRLQMADFAGVEVEDPWDYDPDTVDFFNFFDAHPEYLKILNDFIDSHPDEVNEWLAGYEDF